MAEMVELLNNPTARHSLAHRDITAVFRILRDAGVSQIRLAHATGQQQSEISEIISGRQVQSVALLERIADGLGVPRGWLGLAYAPSLASEPVTPDDAATEDARKANLLRHAATVLYGAPVFGCADPIRVTNHPTPVPRRIGFADVEQVTITTERLGQLTGDFGGIPMTAALTAHTRASEALLGATMRETVSQRLLVALADAHSAAGAAAAGAGLRDRARQHYIRSMDCAGAGGSPLRAVASLDKLGCEELNVEPNEALKIFQLGAATAPSPLPRALVEYHCALALGMLGAVGEALAALRRARDTYQTASDEPRPWPHFAVALPHIEGCTYLALGRFDRAAVALSTATNGTSHAVGCAMYNFAHLATAQLRSGELRSGLLTAGRAIRLAKGFRSVSVRDGLAPLQQAAAARRDSACQDLARELATLRSAA
ncbi:MAG TPA: helix-turn-helix transcriptional regulator [Pseudonocardiaceae bacterium]|jgi:transcriptional regulator with XRE-family HTH domain|nr:helix-turn-helix transcriptional regulator [Pseudonocardiaceae bacterium]